MESHGEEKWSFNGTLSGMALYHVPLDPPERDVLKTCSKNSPEFLPLSPVMVDLLPMTPLTPSPLLSFAIALVFTWREFSHTSRTALTRL